MLIFANSPLVVLYLLTSRKLNLNRQTLRKPSSNKVPMRGKSLVKLRVKEKKTDLRVIYNDKELQ